MARSHRCYSIVGGLFVSFYSLVSSAAAPDLIGKWLPAARWSLEAGAENFRWREFDDDGQRLLTEQGPRFVYGAALGNFHRIKDGVIYDIRLGGHLAEVDYDGQDWPAGRFVATVSEYAGWSGEVDGGYRFARFIEGAAVDVFGGVGLDNWRRVINSGINANGQPISGATEDYAVDYLRFGVGFAQLHAYPNGYLQMGFRRPFSISEKARVGGVAINLSPGETATAFLSYRIFLGRSRSGDLSGSYVKFYYAGYRLKRSENVGFAYQPRSDMDTLGVMLGYVY